jgi:hypothetical protein
MVPKDKHSLWPPNMDSHSANYYKKNNSMVIFGGFHGDRFACSNSIF